VDGLPEMPTTTKSLVTSLTPPRSSPPVRQASPWRRAGGVASSWRRDVTRRRALSPVPALMFRPYGRVMVLHVVILVGGFLVTKLGSPLIPLALVVVLKTGLDLSGHRGEHAGVVGGPASDLLGLV